MKYQNRIALVIAATLLVVVLLVWPMVSGIGGSPFCQPGASAQDNPCAPQEATIAALEATIAALTGGAAPAAVTQEAAPAVVVAAATPVPPPVEGTPLLTDALDSNQRGWYLIPTDNTSANITDGRLLFRADPGWFRWATVPELNVTNFYIQAQVSTPDVRNTLVGFAVGNGQTSQYHFFVLGEDGLGGNREWVARVYEWSGSGDLTRALSTSLGADPLWNDGDTVTLGLAGQAGTHTLYLNGNAVESAQFAAYGNQIGLFFYASPRAASAVSASFDNLSVSQ